MIRTHKNLTIIAAESGSAMIEVVTCFKKVYCETGAIPTGIDKGYVYVYLKTAETVFMTEKKFSELILYACIHWA